MKVWSCTIGEVDQAKLTGHTDAQMRKAVVAAYELLTGEEPKFIFSGWGGKLTESERAVVEDREPNLKVQFEEVIDNGKILLSELKHRLDQLEA